MTHTVRLMNNRLMWIRLPDDSDWYRIAPDRGPWWTHDREEAAERARQLDAVHPMIGRVNYADAAGDIKPAA